MTEGQNYPNGSLEVGTIGYLGKIPIKMLLHGNKSIQRAANVASPTQTQCAE